MCKQELDYELVVELQNGNVDAFDKIFMKYGDRLFGFALGYLKSKEETENLIQNVFLKIWENRKKLKKESSLKSYLFTIAYHEICEIFRKKKIYNKFLEERIAAKEETTNLETQLEFNDTLKYIEHLVTKLPEKQRIIFIKRNKEGKSSKEIAKELNISPGTVDNNISAALKFLREHTPDCSFAFLLFLEVFIKK